MHPHNPPYVPLAAENAGRYLRARIRCLDARTSVTAGAWATLALAATALALHHPRPAGAAAAVLAATPAALAIEAHYWDTLTPEGTPR